MKIKEGNLYLNPNNESDWNFMKLIPKLTKDTSKFAEKNLTEVCWDGSNYVVPINELDFEVNPDDFTQEGWESLRDYQDNLVELISDESRKQIAMDYMESSPNLDDIKRISGLEESVVNQVKLTKYFTVPELFDKIEGETDGKAFTELLNRFDKDQLLEDAGVTTGDILAYLKKKGQVLDVIKEYISSQDLMRFMDDVKISIGNAFQYIWNQLKKKFNELGKN